MMRYLCLYQIKFEAETTCYLIKYIKIMNRNNIMKEIYTIYKMQRVKIFKIKIRWIKKQKRNIEGRRIRLKKNRIRMIGKMMENGKTKDNGKKDKMINKIGKIKEMRMMKIINKYKKLSQGLLNL